MRLFISVALASLTAACSHKQVFKNTYAVNEPNGAKLIIKWSKIKSGGKRFDTSLSLKNGYPFAVVIAANAYRIYRDSEEGEISKNNARVVLLPGDSFNQTLTADFGEQGTGAHKIKLENITKGADSVVTVHDEHSNSKGAAFVGHHLGVATGTTDSSGQTYSMKSAIEGSQLPSIELVVPEEKVETKPALKALEPSATSTAPFVAPTTPGGF